LATVVLYLNMPATPDGRCAVVPADILTAVVPVTVTEVKLGLAPIDDALLAAAVAELAELVADVAASEALVVAVDADVDAPEAEVLA